MSQASPSHQSSVREALAGLRLVAPETLAAVQSVASTVTVEPGGLVFERGEASIDLYSVVSGTVALTRVGDECGNEVDIGRVGPGDLLGETSFLDGAARPLTARAASACVLLRIHPFDLLELPGGDRFYDNLRASMGVYTVKRLRERTETYIQSLERELSIVSRQRNFGQFFTLIVVTSYIGQILYDVIRSNFSDSLSSLGYAWGSVAFLSIPYGALIWRFRIPIQDPGLTLKGLRRSLFEGAAISAALIGVAILVADPLQELGITGDQAGIPATLPLTLYAIHSFLQELLARGFLQTSLQTFLMDESGWMSIALAAVVFASMHLYFGLSAVAVTFVSSLGFGYLYRRHKNLAGVTLVHFVGGVCAFALGLIAAP